MRPINYSLHEILDYPSCKRELIRILLIILVIITVSTAIVCFIFLIVLPDLSAPIVITSSGLVQGNRIFRFHRHIDVYLGIPYAQPPIGHLRFARPKPVEPWTGKLKATVQPPNCYQFPFGESINLFGQSEDCLYLNLYVPKVRSHNRGHRPIVVFIHGGGFMSGKIDSYDPSILAIEGDLIVAIIAYRLNIFGFLSNIDAARDDEESPKGNMGLYDQLLAIEWIKNNAKVFDGDPDNIILFGDYTGSMSVGYHMISNRTNGLFRRAILLNGSPFSLSVLGRQRIRNKLTAIINATSCWSSIGNDSGNEKVTKLNGKVFDCLRTLSPERLIEIDVSLSRKSIKFFGYYPNLNEQFFQFHPFETIETGKFGSQVEIMVGYNGHYESWMNDLGLTDFIINKTRSSGNVTANMVQTRLAKYFPNISPQYYSILSEVIMEGQPSLSPIAFAKRVHSLTTDMVIRCPNYFLITSFISNETRRAYFFEIKASMNRQTIKSLLDSPYAQNQENFSRDVDLIFGYPIDDDRKNQYNEDEIKMSEQLMKKWIQFIRNGQPTTDDSWLPCSSETGIHRFVFQGNSYQLVEGYPDNQCEQYFHDIYTFGRSF